MTGIEIIPAIDLIDGRCVRLRQGDYSRMTVYRDDPLAVARLFEETGLKRLHLVDLDGAKAGHIINHKILERIAKSTNLIIDYGGGLKTDSDLEIAFQSGASMVTGGSIAVMNREVFLGWLHKYGSERIILGADFRDEMISVNGWQQSTPLGVIDFIQDYYNSGIRKVISTDIKTDGMLSGPSLFHYKRIMEQVPGINLTASGGVSSISDILELKSLGVSGVITGKALYENKITLKEISDFNLKQQT